MTTTTLLSVYIVDDELLARERLKRLLLSLPNFKLIGEAENGEQAIREIATLRPDITILDIRMPGKDGLEVAHHLSAMAVPPSIIFCTAYDEYAIRAFKYSAIAYLLKPVRQEELAQALQQATRLSQVQLKQLEQQQANEKSLSIIAHSWQGHERIAMDSILYFQADQKYITIYHTQGETLTDQTLKQLESNYTSLLRAHRNTLVNPHHIKALVRDKDSQYYLELSNHHKIAVSRRHVSQVKLQLANL